jgi:hypothetical protein
VRFEKFGELLRHALVKTPMKIDSDIESERADSFDTLDGILQSRRRIDPGDRVWE